MKNWNKILGLAALCVAFSIVLFFMDWNKDDSEFAENIESIFESEGSVPQALEPTRELLFGERILEGYGSGDPKEDLRKMNSAVLSYRMLAKGMDARHFSSNGDVASALRGEKRIALAALPKGHPIFNEDGLIVDRWGAPLLFHLEREDRLGIYSAGPDGDLGTEDDYSIVSGEVRIGIPKFN